MHTDNPAGRLLYILKEGKKLSQQSTGKNAWANLLDVDEKNLSLLMSRLGKVMELPDQIIQQVKEHYPNQGETHKHWSAKVNTAFTTQNLNGSWTEFTKHIDSHTIDYLSMSVDLLDMKTNTKIISDEQLSKTHESINNILFEILESDINEDFKKYIVHYLRKILTSIEEYKISGAVPIIESIESTLGHAFIDQNYRSSLQESELGQKIVTILSTAAAVMTVAVGLPQLPETFQFLLNSPNK